jgi:hypothetical protein
VPSGQDVGGGIEYYDPVTGTFVAEARSFSGSNVLATGITVLAPD